jgi:hypothetical protein
MMQERDHGGDPFVSRSYLDVGYSDFSSTRAVPTPYGASPAASSQAQLAESGYRDEPEPASYPPASPNNSGMLLPAGASSAAAAPTRNYPTKATKGSRRTRMILLGLFALVVVAAAVVIPIYFLVIKKHANSAAKASANGTTASGKTVVGAVSGGDGSTVQTDSGASFVYKNPYGGYCACLAVTLCLALAWPFPFGVAFSAHLSPRVSFFRSFLPYS